jgi:hypothetical protein
MADDSAGQSPIAGAWRVSDPLHTAMPPTPVAFASELRHKDSGSRGGIEPFDPVTPIG